MRSKDKKDLMWVHPSFKKVVKSAAAEKGESVIQYTKALSEYASPIERLVNDVDKKKKKYDFF